MMLRTLLNRVKAATTPKMNTIRRIHKIKPKNVAIV